MSAHTTEQRDGRWFVLDGKGQKVAAFAGNLAERLAKRLAAYLARELVDKGADAVRKATKKRKKGSTTRKKRAKS